MSLDAEEKRVAKLSDDEVLRLSGNGKFGPGIIGKALHARASKIIKDTGGGRFGPAITDPDYAAKQAAAKGKRVAPIVPQDDSGEDGEDDELEEEVVGGPVDPTDIKDPRNPWTYVTLSGAKVLAQKHGVSYVPRIKRTELIGDLQAAGVVPPAIPDDLDEDDDA